MNYNKERNLVSLSVLVLGKLIKNIFMIIADFIYQTLVIYILLFIYYYDMSFQTLLPKRDPTLSFFQHIRYIDNFIEVEYDKSLSINHLPNSNIIRLRFQDNTHTHVNMNQIQNDFFQKEHASKRFEYYIGNQNHILPMIMTPFTTPGLCYIKSKITELLALDIVKINIIFNTSFVGRRNRMIQMNCGRLNVNRANSFSKRINQPMIRSNQIPNMDNQLIEWNETLSPST